MYSTCPRARKCSRSVRNTKKNLTDRCNRTMTSTSAIESAATAAAASAVPLTELQKRKLIYQPKMQYLLGETPLPDYLKYRKAYQTIATENDPSYRFPSKKRKSRSRRRRKNRSSVRRKKRSSSRKRRRRRSR